MRINIDDIKDNLSDVAAMFVLKIRKTAKILKLKSDECSISGDIKREYRWLGEKYYMSLKDSRKTPDVSKNVENIDYLNQQLMTVKAQIKNEQNQKMCHVCSSFSDKSSVYCPKCGHKF